MRPWLALAALLVALPAPAAAAAPSASPEVAGPEVSGTAVGGTAVGGTAVGGTVSAVDLQRHRLTVDTPDGPVELGWDRNTLIYRPGGATNASALTPGAVVKAGLDPARTAYWIQVRPPAAAPAPGRTPAPALPARPAPPADPPQPPQPPQPVQPVQTGR